MAEHLISNLFIFVLASFLGIEVIRRVSPLLHTPLMSLTNAISAISLVGSLTLLGRAESTLSTILGGVAVFASMTNVVSGFLITERMLKMFKSKKPAAAAHSFILPVFLLAAVSTGGIDVSNHMFSDLTYLVAAGMFVMSLKWMNHPTTARRSVWVGEGGMALAIVATLIAMARDPELVSANRAPAYGYIVIALVLGTVVGIPISRVAMTAVPQRTAFSHAFGGLAAGLVGTAEYFRGVATGAPDNVNTAIICLEVLLGFITFTGSLIAFGKLAEVLRQRPLTYPGQNVVNAGLFLIGIGCAIGVIINP